MDYGTDRGPDGAPKARPPIKKRAVIIKRPQNPIAKAENSETVLMQLLAKLIVMGLSATGLLTLATPEDTTALITQLGSLFLGIEVIWGLIMRARLASRKTSEQLANVVEVLPPEQSTFEAKQAARRVAGAAKNRTIETTLDATEPVSTQLEIKGAQ